LIAAAVLVTGLAGKLALGPAAGFLAAVDSWVETRGRADAEGIGEVTFSVAAGFAGAS